MNYKFILLYVTCVNYCNDVNSYKLLQGCEFNNLTLRDGILYYPHDTTSQIRKGMKTQCFHGFRSHETIKYILKGLLQV